MPPHCEDRVLSESEKDAFRKTVRGFFRDRGRKLPWRETRDPYRILVSEIMLQQTQVPRVLEKYESFLAEFPDIRSLAAAPLHEVLAAWQGLGYNRRAAYLKKAAEMILSDFNGAVPSSPEKLKKLPGIGEATASAVCAFAFNQPVVFVETNIRAVYIHHFFGDEHPVSDARLLPLVAQTLDRSDPRGWYNALMDYGVYLKKEYGNPARRSAHHHRQAPFEGSSRQVRGAVLRVLLEHGGITQRSLIRLLPFDASRILHCLEELEREGLIRGKKGHFEIA